MNCVTQMGRLFGYYIRILVGWVVFSDVVKEGMSVTDFTTVGHIARNGVTVSLGLGPSLG